MKTIKILDWPTQRFYSETHPFYKWKNELSDCGFKIKFYHHHLDHGLKDADYLLIHSRYFDNGRNIHAGKRDDEEFLIDYLLKMRNFVKKIIWFDAADSTGSSDFSIISYVDIFLKKQVLKNKDYYLNNDKTNNLRIWMNSPNMNNCEYPFDYCPKNQIHKIKVGWNIGFNDYRYFGYKMNRLSNYLSYQWYPLKFTETAANRNLDLTFRGTIHQDNGINSGVSEQRNKVINLMNQLNLKIASGMPIPKKSYWKELRNAKLSVSPYGWGEVCYRDFESFIAGALLIKPSMEHLETVPNCFIPNQTYIPIDWNINDLPDKLAMLTKQYKAHQQIAINGQKTYLNAINNPNVFINTLLNAL
jgi:hypothetical protein